MQIDGSGNVAASNRAQIDAQMLGNNPWVLGIQQQYNDFSGTIRGRANPGRALADVAMTLGSLYLGKKIGGKWGATLALAASPAIVHGLKDAWSTTISIKNHLTK